MEIPSPVLDTVLWVVDGNHGLIDANTRADQLHQE